MTEPFEDSRRLTGCNLYFAGSGAALETAPGLAFDAAALARWRDNIATLRTTLGWGAGEVYVRRHASGAALAYAAPFDQLYAAAEANEWAWYDALGLVATEPVMGEDDSARPHAASLPRDAALAFLAALAAQEAKPAWTALQQAADDHDVPLLADDDAISLGLGAGGRTWPVDALPAVYAVPWPELRTMPVALVTGSNGKTTTVRLLAAMLRAHGLHTSHCCTEGVYFDNALIEGGDFSGPGGARTALRHPQAQAAVLESARGGLLRRGLALCSANVAVVTNISADHYGEYGVHDLDDLAAAKLVVARAVGDAGLLVLNADDQTLRRQAKRFDCPLGWFAQDLDGTFVAAHRAAGGLASGVRDGSLVLSDGVQDRVVGPISKMPLTLGGRAAYNIANIAAATLAAHALGIPDAVVGGVLERFGNALDDNAGRLQAWRFGDAHVVVDYAHNPDGLHGLMRAVDAQGRPGRLTVLLGHAGNREDADLRAVATTVAGYRPDRVILKDIAGYERGRAPGEIASIMRQALRDAGTPEARIETHLDEVEAAMLLMQDMHGDDLVVLPIHETAARDVIVATLERMRARQWRPGDALPKEQGIVDE